MRRKSFTAIVCIFVTAIMIVVAAPISVSANEDLIVVSPELAELVAERQQVGVSTTIDKVKSLYDFDENPSYKLLKLKPSGYMVTTAANEVLEYSFDFFDERLLNNKIYYGGALTFFVREDLQFKDVLTNVLLSPLRFETNIRNVMLEQESLPSAHTESYSNLPNDVEIYGDYFSTLKDFGNNVNGTCVSVAYAMLLGFYDVKHNNSFVEDKYRQGTGTSESFHQYLNSVIFPNGAELMDVFEGGDRVYSGYLSKLDVCLSKRESFMGNSQNTLKEKLYNNIPCVLSISTADAGHAVVAYGYSVKESGTEFLTHYGGLGTFFEPYKFARVWISASQLNGYVYIYYLNEHRHSSYEYNYSGHNSICSNCRKEYRYLLHSIPSYDSRNHWGKCYCGHITPFTAHSFYDKLGKSYCKYCVYSTTGLVPRAISGVTNKLNIF